MKTWIVLASHDDGGQRVLKLADDPNTLERVTAFTSGDGDLPTDADLDEAMSGYTTDGVGEFLLVCLDGAKSVSLRIEPKVELVSFGNYVPGLAVH